MADNYFTQQNETWLRQKWGKFSASEITKLLPGEKTKPAVGETLFHAGAITYIKRVARESYTVFNTEETVETYDMKQGKLREPAAFEHLFKLIGVSNLKHFGGDNPLFVEYGPESGCSPDSLAETDQGVITFGAEIKAPKGDTHFDYVRFIHDQETFKTVCPEYNAQCQFSMMCCKCDVWLFASYNEFFPLKSRALVVEVKKDQRFCDNLDIRLRNAVKRKNEFVEEIMNKIG